jgi:hypothetical protein
MFRITKYRKALVDKSGRSAVNITVAMRKRRSAVQQMSAARRKPGTATCSSTTDRNSLAAGARGPRGGASGPPALPEDAYAGALERENAALKQIIAFVLVETLVLKQKLASRRR